MELTRRFERVICRLEARMDRSDRLLDELSKFSRRALDEIYRMSEAPVYISRHAELATSEKENIETDKEVLMYKDKNLYDQGGVSLVEKAYNVVKALWDEDERRELCIDPKKTLSDKGGRKAGDAERTHLYQTAVKYLFGEEYSVKTYQSILKLVNQRLREKRSSHGAQF